MEPFVICEAVSALSVKDRAGKRFSHASRYAAAFILTGRGRIRIAYAGGELTVDPEHAVYLPEGLTYLNECLCDAESVVLNFHALRAPREPLSCRPIPFSRALEIGERVAHCAKLETPSARCESLSLLYAVAAELLSAEGSRAPASLTERALAFMRLQCDRQSLTVADVARHCHVSEIWLRKLFARELGVSPHKRLTELRMQRAALLLEEKRPIKEIAHSVGYADVYQFSRAYKSYFGHAPTKKASERIP